MKTKEELNLIKEELNALNAKLAEVSDEELKEVAGGFDRPVDENRIPFDAYRERVILRSQAGDHTELDTRKDLYENIIL